MEEVADREGAFSSVVNPCLGYCEIEENMASLRSLKLPGWDEMTGKMYKAIWRAIPSHVQCVLGCYLWDCYLPAFWKGGCALEVTRERYD